MNAITATIHAVCLVFIIAFLTWVQAERVIRGGGIVVIEWPETIAFILAFFGYVMTSVARR